MHRERGESSQMTIKMIEKNQLKILPVVFLFFFLNKHKN
jgi:hypothetical protein